jgi:archaellum component FlaF (FlaF/FlaG flagellin family)
MAKQTKKAVKKAASKKVIKKVVPLKTKPTQRGKKASRGFSITGVVVLTVTFRDVAAGNSNITATFNGEESRRTSSGTITFSGVATNDLILIDGNSPGTTQITISVPATPRSLNFAARSFNDSFVID